MPRIKPSQAGGSTTADRTLSLLSVFRSSDTALSLAELASRSGLYKSTTLRLLQSLNSANFIRRTENGLYCLGGEIMRLNVIASAGGSLESMVMPALRHLVAETRETAALHVKRGNYRVRLHWVDSPQPLREHVVEGEKLPLDRGAGGLVLQAFSGVRGPAFDKIRSQRYALSIGGRIPELSGISSPVFGAKGELIGALTLTMPTHRWTLTLRSAVLEEATALSHALGATPVASMKEKH